MYCMSDACVVYCVLFLVYCVVFHIYGKLLLYIYIVLCSVSCAFVIVYCVSHVVRYISCVNHFLWYGVTCTLCIVSRLLCIS